MTGECHIDGEVIIHDPNGIIMTKGDCLKSGGTWVEKPDGICFVRDVLTRSLGEHILELGATFSTAVAFRDSILTPTAVGERYLAFYYDSLPLTFETVRANYTLVGSFIDMWFAVLPFVEGLVAAANEDPNGNARIVYHQRVHDRVVGVLEQFEQQAGDTSYASTIAELRADLGRFVGLTADQALAALRADAKRS